MIGCNRVSEVVRRSLDRRTIFMGAWVSFRVDENSRCLCLRGIDFAALLSVTTFCERLGRLPFVV